MSSTEAATAYFTHNNAWDSIVIPASGQYLQVGTQGQGKELADFMADDPGDFLGDWSGQNMDEGEDWADYGELVAYRQQGGPVVIVDEYRWEERLQFHGLVAQ